MNIYTRSMKRISLTKGKYAIVDDEDYHYLSRFTWQYALDEYGNESVRKSFHHKFGIRHTNMEDYIISRPLGGNNSFVFLNGNRLDFRKVNMDFVGIEGVKQRARKQENTISKYKGVSINTGRRYQKYNPERKKWRAQIEKGKRGSLEYKCLVQSFHTEIEAAKYYNEKARELYGKFAYQNVIK